jgi:hypothetical protein
MNFPAVSLRYTAGYAHLAPAGLKRRKQKTTYILPIIL